MIEGSDESEHGAGGRQVDVTARFVGLGFEREFIAVSLVNRVLAEKVERFAVPFQSFARIFRRINLGAFASTPENIDVRSQLGA